VGEMVKISAWLEKARNEMNKWKISWKETTVETKMYPEG
jgi:hypothetical protein